MLNDGVIQKSDFREGTARSVPKVAAIADGRLCRDWKGKTYEVLVRQDGGFEFDGEIYRSLTAIAEKITGTHWNGKKFFGVK